MCDLGTHVRIKPHSLYLTGHRICFLIVAACIHILYISYAYLYTHRNLKRQNIYRYYVLFLINNQKSAVTER